MQRPVSVVIVGWLFIATGLVGFLYHLGELKGSAPFANDAVLVLLVRILAVVGGILVLRGFNVGRWLLVLWLAYHVVLSYFHDVTSTIVHLLFLVVIAYLLFERKARGFFIR